MFYYLIFHCPEHKIFLTQSGLIHSVFPHTEQLDFQVFYSLAEMHLRNLIHLEKKCERSKKRNKKKKSPTLIRIIIQNFLITRHVIYLRATVGIQFKYKLTCKLFEYAHPVTVT